MQITKSTLARNKSKLWEAENSLFLHFESFEQENRPHNGVAKTRVRVTPRVRVRVRVEGEGKGKGKGKVEGEGGG